MSGRFRRVASGIAAIVAAAAAFDVANGWAQKEPPPPQGTPRDFTLPAPRRFTLSNGLAVTMVPFGQVPKVAIRLVVGAGNLHEQKNEVWLADVTGSMMQEGTTSLTADALAREFAAMGADLDVAVGEDSTSVSAEVLADRGVQAVQLIADVAQHPRLPESELRRVKANMIRDLAIRRETPQSIAQEKFIELLYGDHPYGRLFPTEAMLNGYTIDQVRSFHRKHFGAPRSRLYVAGVFDAAAMEAAIRRAFDAWTRATIADTPKVPAPGSRRFALLDRAGAPQSTVLLGTRVPDPSHKDWMALEVTDYLLGGAFASRITANIREQKGYTYSPVSSIDTHPGDAYWVEAADVTTDATGASLKEIFFEIDRLRKEAPPADELQGIKNNLAGIFVMQNASRNGVINRLSFVDRHRLGDEYLTSYVRRVMAITPQDVQRVATEYLVPDKMTLVVVGDTKTVKDQLGPWSK
jgi:predicted Zn-dependent peptidase